MRWTGLASFAIVFSAFSSWACSESASNGDARGGAGGGSGGASVDAAAGGRGSGGSTGNGAGGMMGGSTGTDAAGDASDAPGSGSGGMAGATAGAGGRTSTADGGASDGWTGGSQGAGGITPDAASASGGAGGAWRDARQAGGAGGNGSVEDAGAAGDAAATCDPALATANRTLVAKALDELFVRKDTTAIDRYWSDPYYQHNPVAKSGVETFRGFMVPLVTSSGFSYTPLLTLAECDLAIAYGRYSQTGVIFDMFRIRDGKIMEHWDSDTSGASETSGLGARQDSSEAAENRQLFLQFAEQVLIAGDLGKAGEFLDEAYVEHHGQRATGAAAFSAYVNNERVSYTKVHHLIADGNFVFALSEGKRGSTSHAFYDLFRVAGGKLVEHWDARRAVPSSTASGLGIF